MAAGFSVRTYGTIAQNPPFKADVNGLLTSVEATYPSDQCQLASFPTSNINIWSIQPGVKMAGGVFCYGVVEVPASGLTQLYSTKYVVKETEAQLASLRG